MNYVESARAFQTYLKGYDQKNEKVRLKIVHTFGVVRQADEICRRMSLSAEDRELAKVIALLHDIGRFEQLKRFDSFEPTTMDHAAYGVQVLFEEGMIRQFVPETTWDDIIRTAIARHSDFILETIGDPRTLLHARLIRDADKLDNFRVRLEDDLTTFLGMTAEEIGSQKISPAVCEAVMQDHCVLSANRVTKIDYWVSYLAHVFDINFKESLDIIAENDYLSRTVRRIPYSDPETARQMAELLVHAKAYMERIRKTFSSCRSECTPQRSPR